MRLTILSSLRISLQDRPLYLVPTLASFVGNQITIKVLIGHVKLTNRSLHICLIQQSLGALCIPIAYTALFAATGKGDVRFGAIGDGETLVWRKPWFGGLWMLELEKQSNIIARHTDAAVTGCVVPFNVNACKCIAGHAVLHTMEFLEDTKEVVEVFEAHIFKTKIICKKVELDGPPFVAPETKS